MTDGPGVWYMVMAAQAHQVILTTCSNRTTFPVRLDLYAEADQGRVKVLFASSDATYGCAVLSEEARLYSEREQEEERHNAQFVFFDI